MSNLRYWDKISKPPVEVLKPIQAGRLKGKSDVNPMWRMQAMTETFGPCGSGWKYTIDKLWLERGAPVKKENNEPREEVAAFALISLFYKDGEHWSEPIPGIGGSMFTEMEKYGPFNSDEAFKMAVTDALSVAMKALGVAAEIYLGNFDGSKYTGRAKQPAQTTAQKPQETKQEPAGAQKTETAHTLSAEQEKYFPRVKAALDSIFGAAIELKKAKIKELTSFPEKKDGELTGKTIQGVEDYRKLDGKRLQILCQNLEKLVPKRDAEICAECRELMDETGTCRFCREVQKC